MANASPKKRKILVNKYIQTALNNMQVLEDLYEITIEFKPPEAPKPVDHIMKLYDAHRSSDGKTKNPHLESILCKHKTLSNFDAFFGGVDSPWYKGFNTEGCETDEFLDKFYPGRRQLSQSERNYLDEW